MDLFSNLLREKNKSINVIRKFISPDCPHERIFTKFGTYVPLVDISNRDKLYVNLFKVFDFHRKLTSPL